MSEFDNWNTMRIKVGDRVRFLNEIGGGKVKRLLDKQMVEVETADGWGIPYLINELVVIPDDPEVAPFRPESDPVIKAGAGSTKKFGGTELSKPAVFLLAVQNLDQRNSFNGLSWYLVNDSHLNLHFAYYQSDEVGSSLVEADLLEAGTKMLLQELSLADLSSIKGFHIQGILIPESSGKMPPLISRYIPMNIKKFAASGGYTENDFLHEPAMLFDALEKEESDAENSLYNKDSLNQELNQTKTFRSGKMEVVSAEIDLHINQLVDSVVGMSNREILRIQMERFHSEMNTAILGGVKQIVFIHGIGNGTLKESLRNSLVSDYPVCSFEDASFKEYGFGATMVRIRQNK